jgi:hypothetical protein
MALSASIISRITGKISRQYPEMKNVRPSVQKQGGSSAKSVGMYLVKFETTVITDNGKRIKRSVRVTVDENGNILRTSTSR